MHTVPGLSYPNCQGALDVDFRARHLGWSVELPHVRPHIHNLTVRASPSSRKLVGVHLLTPFWVILQDAVSHFFKDRVLTGEDGQESFSK